ncbi:MAG: M48 family metallopeptidase, partial [Alphaproteobacteria bacterium]
MSRTQRTASATVKLGGRQVALAVRWNPQARRFILRVDAATGGARLTLPTHANLEEAIAFLGRNEDWFVRQKARLNPSIGFADAVLVPLRGVPHKVTAAGGRSARIWLEESDLGPKIQVPGRLENLSRRLLAWLKAQARQDLKTSVDHHARALGVRPARITIRDQRSRWGSCSSAGTLSFSWRLILAPPEILDYVAAHEVAHLREMNHGPNFWR